MNHASGWWVTVLAYGAVAGVAVVLQVVALRRPDRVPTLGAVLTWAMRRRSTQVALLFVWWWVGWHLVTDR